jgi:N-acetylglucosamine-6-phosphate deacetylase
MKILNAQIPRYEGLQQIAIDARGTIAQISPMTDSTDRSDIDSDIDAAGLWISPGGLDLQINGALGLAFTEVTPQHQPTLTKICQFLWDCGIDGFLPTLVTTSIENIHRSLGVFANFIANSDSNAPTQPQATLLGVHLEGPFLNPQKRGAHPAQFLLPLTVDRVKQVLGDDASVVKSVVKVITLAPELDPTGDAIAYLRSLGITVSLGHSQATAAEANRAFDLGATMVTHAFNAMPGLHHRQPGLLGAAIVRPQVRCGFIADGEHVCPTMLQILLQASQFDRGLFLVSDALAPLGLPDGIYPWDSRQIEVKDGTARLPDGTLSGTTRPLLAGANNLVQWGICGVEQAIALATMSPRQAIDLNPLLGQPAAHLLQWQETPTGLNWRRLLSPGNQSRKH